MGHTSLNPTESDKKHAGQQHDEHEGRNPRGTGLKPGPSHGALLPAGSMISMRRKAFTLVELLVVVAVIAILISLLLPAINRFRVQAQSTECLTNQRAFDCRVHPIFDRQERPGPGDRYRGIRLRLDANRRPGQHNPPGGCCNGFHNNVNNWDQGGDDANPNTEYLKAFTDGSLWDYIGDFDVYSSPQDPRIINDPETYRTSQLFILCLCWQRGFFV